MRMVEAEHVEAAGACCPTSVDVPLGIQDELIGIGGDVSHPHRLDDVRAGAEEDAATLTGKRVARVLCDVLQG